MDDLLLREFASETTEDGTKIARVRARVSNHPERKRQTEWIEFNLGVGDDVPTGRSGALLRKEALTRAIELLQGHAKEFERIAKKQAK